MLLNYNKNTGFGGILGSNTTNARNSIANAVQNIATSKEDLDLLNLADQKLMKGESLDGITKQFDKANTATKEFVNTLTTQLPKGQQVMAGLKNVGAQLFTTLINGFVSLGASVILSAIITNVSKLADKLVITRKEAEALSKQFDDTFSSEIAERAKTADEIADIEGEYEKLSKGVSVLGENISLTDEEFERYHEITRIIAENIPSLINGYDDQGEAIIRLRDDVRSLSDAYKENQELAALDLYNQTDDNGNIIEGVYKKAQNDIGDTDELVVKNLNTGAQDIVAFDVQKKLEVLRQLASATKEEILRLGEANGYADVIIGELWNKGYDLYSDNEDEIARIHNQLQKDATELAVTLEADAKRVAQAGMTYAQAWQGYYTMLSSDEQKYFDAVMNSMDFDYMFNFRDSQGNNLFNQDTMETYVQNLVRTIHNLTDDQKAQIQIGLDISSKWNNGELSYDEYIQKVQEFAKVLATLFPGNDQIQKSIMLLFDIQSPEDIQGEIDKRVERGKRLFGEKVSKPEVATTPTTFGGKALTADKVGDILENNKPAKIKLEPEIEVTDESIAKWEETYTKWQRKLSDGQAAILDMVSDEELMLTIGFDEDDFDKWFKGLQAEADEHELEIHTKYSEQASDIDKLESSFGGLSTAYETSQSGEKVSGSELAKVASDMGGVTFDVEGGDVEKINALSNALEEYSEKLITCAGDTEKTQDAADKLVTAYVDQSGVLEELLRDVDHVDDEYKQWMIDQLKAKGITNAEEVVNTRLTKQYAKQAEALTNLSKKVAQYRSKIDQAMATNQDFEGVAGNIKDEVEALLKTYDEAGNEVFTPDIDSDFIVKHLELINRAVEGDIDAIKELRVEAARQIDVSINLDDSQVYQAHNELIDLVAGLDASSFDIDGYMNNSAAYAEMNNLISRAGYTASEVKSILSAASNGTITAKVEYEDIVTDVPSSTLPDVATKNAAKHGSVTYTKTPVRVPKFVFKYNEGASKATYGGGGGGTSGGGGGGGGGNGGGTTSTPKEATEDNEELFDWIEVYISELERAFDKLDDMVNDTYDNWDNRNNNVREEIKNLTKQIDSNKKAAEAYQKYADNKVKINNGNATVNAKDYGEDEEAQKAYDQKQLDEANRIWNKGTYQKLIKEGKLAESAIETIKNKYLVEAINAYREWYNKAKDATDKSISLAYTLKSKYEQIFNNIKSKYDSLIDHIEAKSDIIEKRINRMEEDGHFVNESYYRKQLKLTDETIKTQEKELKALVEKYNDAIKHGIDKDSEAARSMLSEIYAAESSMEESLTQKLTINNNIRQLGWDKFNWLEERLQSINKEAEHFQNIFSHYEQVDEKGNFTNEGLASLAMDEAVIQSDTEALKRLQAQYEELRGQLKGDETDKDIIEEMENVKDNMFSTEEEISDKIEDMRSKLKEAFDANLSYLNKMIDKYKKAMQDAKDLYSYQKNIENQTNNLLRLEKQMAAYRGDTSEAGRKKQVELAQKYKDAQEQLKETEWDKYISETNEMLDNLYSDYEEFLNEYLKDFDTIHSDMQTIIKANPTAIATAMNEKLSGWDKDNTALGGTLSNLVTGTGGINEKIGGVTSAIQKACEDTINYFKETAKEGDVAKNDAGGYEITIGKDGTITIKKKTAPTASNGSNTSNATKMDGMSEKEKAKRLKTIESDLEDAKNQKAKVTADLTREKKKKNPNQAQIAYLQDLKDEYTNRVNALNSEKNKLLGKKAKGSKRISRAGMYETNEAGYEFIYKTQSGGILTPLDVGDKVFTNEMSQRLWDIASNNIPVGANVQMVNIPQSGIGGTVNVNAEMDITLPNVTNYDEFKTELQKDSKFEKFIKEITIGQLNGNNTMNKRKY